MTTLDPTYIESVVRMALREDIGSGDITTLLTISEECRSTAHMVAKEAGVLAGIEVAAEVFARIDPTVDFEIPMRDGSEVSPGQVIGVAAGNTRAILAGERVALNFVQRMSGIATLTAKYVSMVSHTKARIVDTRKTAPGLRMLEKYAVLCGGGFNHRFGLSDGILIKDNHIAACGGVSQAVAAAREKAPHTLRVEVEVTNLEQLREAVDACAEIVMLDNMDIPTMGEAVRIAAGKILLEASGGVSEANVREIAETGVDIISVGALTHSAPALDISLNVVA